MWKRGTFLRGSRTLTWLHLASREPQSQGARLPRLLLPSAIAPQGQGPAVGDGLSPEACRRGCLGATRAPGTQLPYLALAVAA